MNLTEFVQKIVSGEKRPLSRAITYIESEYPESEELLKSLSGYTGRAYKIGITGPPGAGKSSITNQLTKLYISQGKKVAIIAVDPTSPFTGGALLGDRVRMSDIGNTESVFIRSMATRGSLGGLNTKANDTADIFDAAGYDYIIFETVGVGQSELDIAKTADTVIVVLVPESGDSVQAMKAGLMEIADFYVVNKCDRPGSEQAVSAIRTILMMRAHDENSWMPDIIKCVATENKGLKEIEAEIQRHHTYLLNSGNFEKRRNNHFTLRVKELVEKKILNEIWHNNNMLFSIDEKNNLKEGVSPYVYAESILEEFKKNLSERN